MNGPPSEVVATLERRDEADGFKRYFNVACAGALLPLLLPVILLLLSLVRLDSRGNPLFIQTRVGRGGRHFTLYKLRTFHCHCHGFYGDEEIRWKDPRVTRVGNWLRRSKLDELPQILNVLRGDMSLVGPRPDLPEQVRYYGPAERARLIVRPGVTGVAQISGNTWFGWPQRIRMDRWYVANRSLMVDLRVLWHTVPIMFRGERATDDPLGVRVVLSIPSPVLPDGGTLSRPLTAHRDPPERTPPRPQPAKRPLPTPRPSAGE